MFKSNTKIQPQYKIKHRLTGAVIIVALAIIVISVLLKEPESQSSAKSSNHYGRSEQTFESKAQPLKLDTINLDQTEMQKIEAPIKTTRQTAPTTEGNLVLTIDKKSNSGSKTSQQPPDPSSQDISEGDISLNKSGWSVRVGTYSDIENVDSVSTLLINSGFRTQHTQVQTTLGVATRIWLGPYTKKETAEKVSMRLKAITGEKGYVTKHSS
ncbi:SPOR domain-containing protein [Candidatus Spongiihabitans sp.]|uniref:SPOR domain-containing protein n=1 Tax=Candidatus Spongiihabitans sp. TaxID=3101308 RepID=UPI003C6F8A19